MDIFKLAALAVIAALCALILRRQAPELALVLTLAAGGLIMGASVSALAQLKGGAEALARTAGLAPQVWAPVWKTVGIGVVTRLAAALCRDAGEGGVAAFLETAGSILALVVALPLAQAVLDTLGGLL